MLIIKFDKSMNLKRNTFSVSTFRQQILLLPYRNIGVPSAFLVIFGETSYNRRNLAIAIESHQKDDVRGSNECCLLMSSFDAKKSQHEAGRGFDCHVRTPSNSKKTQ